MSADEEPELVQVDDLRAELHPGSWWPVQDIARALALSANADGVCDRTVLRKWYQGHYRGNRLATNWSRPASKLRHYLLELEDLGVIWRNDDDTVTVLDWTAISEILDWELR